MSRSLPDAVASFRGVAQCFQLLVELLVSRLPLQSSFEIELIFQMLLPGPGVLYRGVTEHGFRSGCDFDLSWLIRFRVNDRIGEVPEMALLGYIFNLIVADCSLQKRIPVDEAFALINHAFAEEVIERSPYGCCANVIKSETQPVPVAAASHAFELPQNPFFVLGFPFPDAIDQAFTAKVMAGKIFLFLQATFDDCLRGNSRMVSSRHPQRLITLHSSRSDDNVLQSVIETMPEVQRTGDIGRYHDSEWFPVWIDLGVCTFGVIPRLQDATGGICVIKPSGISFIGCLVEI